MIDVALPIGNVHVGLIGCWSTVIVNVLAPIVGMLGWERISHAYYMSCQVESINCIEFIEKIVRKYLLAFLSHILLQ